MRAPHGPGCQPGWWRLLAGLLLAGLAGLIVIGGAAGASAVPPSATIVAKPEPAPAQPLALLLSIDGVTFSPTLPGGLFDGAGALVPRQSVSAHLWVKNPSTAPAEFRLSAREVTVSDDAFAQTLVLSTWESVSNSVHDTSLAELTALATSAECGIVAPEVPIPAGQVLRLRVTVSMNDGAAPRGPEQWLALNFAAAMRDARAGAFAPSACDDEGVLVSSGSAPVQPAAPRVPELASTGVIWLLPLVGLGALSVGVGAALRRRSGR